MTSPQDAPAIVERLAKLVKTINDPSVDPLTVWNSKIDLERTCDSLLVATTGRIQYTMNIASSCQESSAMHFVTSLGIADIIGDGQASLAELCAKAEVAPFFLRMVMDCLIGRGFFEEAEHFGSRVYKNNYLSDLFRESHPTSLRAGIGLTTDESLRATSHLVDAAKLAAKYKAGSPDPMVHASNLAFNFDGSIFEWMARPEEAWRGKRVGMAMLQVNYIANSHIDEDYPWDKLASPIVDVGGGNGSLEMAVLSNPIHQKLDFIIFDLPKTIDNGQKFWSVQPTAISSRVNFVKGSFMASSVTESNIPQGKPTYVIRHVLHNWTDDEVVFILSRVREAMPANGKLLLVEMLLRAESSRFLLSSGMQLLALSNGISRTQGEFEVLLKRAGFRLTKVTTMRALDCIVEAAMI